jgi:hypothetical protein
MATVYPATEPLTRSHARYYTRGITRRRCSIAMTGDQLAVDRRRDDIVNNRWSFDAGDDCGHDDGSHDNDNTNATSVDDNSSLAARLFLWRSVAGIDIDEVVVPALLYPLTLYGACRVACQCSCLDILV